MRIQINVATTMFLIVIGVLQSLAQKEAPPPQARDLEQVWERPDGTPSFATVFTTATGRTDVARSYAIVIGLSDYTGDWDPIEAPWYDAQHVRDALIGAGFDYIVTLTNKKATKETIRHYMEDVIPDKVQKNDRFIFYYSGHGTQKKMFNGVRGYLPMLDSKIGAWSSMIGMDEIAQWSDNVGEARHSFFLLDACFSGLAGEQHKGDDYVKVYIDDLLKPGHYLMTAGSAGQESYASLKKWGGSLFTDAFLKGIAGAADTGTKEFPPDGVVSITKLYQYVRLRIASERAQVPNVDQTPLLSDLSPKSEGELFFFSQESQPHPRAEPTAVADLTTSAKGYAVVVAPPAETVGSRVDRIYGHGLTDLPDWQFNKTLGELTTYKWTDLPVAGEFPRNDVRYLVLNVSKALPNFKDYGCISPTSYFVFFFESQKLFRIAMRFFDEGQCANHSVWLTHFSNTVGASLMVSNGTRMFDAKGDQVQMLGLSTAGATVVDLVSASGENLMTPDEWRSWILKNF